MSKTYTSVSYSRLLVWVIALVLALGAAKSSSAAAAAPAPAAPADERGEFFGSVAVPAGLSATEVQDAAVAALLGRQWGVKSKSDGAVVGYLKHRSNEATVTLSYTTSKIDIYCVGYEIDKSTGVRRKPEQPKGWLKNIQGDLTKAFNRIVTKK